MALASPQVLLLTLSVAGAVSTGSMPSVNYQKTQLDLSQVEGKTHFVVDGQKNILSCMRSCRKETHCVGFGFRDNDGIVKGDNCVLIKSDGVQKVPASYAGYHYYITVEDPADFCSTSVVGGIGTYSGSWMVVQRRIDGSVDFYRDWAEYKAGFGDPAGEFWLGNDKLHELTKDGDYKLRVELETNGTLAAAEYDTFIVHDELSNYNLTVTGFQGCNPPGDSLSIYKHSGFEFSTKDRDNDLHGDPNVSCAALYKGGWWYNGCHWANLNGLYGSTTFAEGINWFTWTGYEYSLSAVRMMIKKK